jgi:hypothetical protein
VDSTRRTSAMQNLYTKWRNVDDAAANQWLARTSGVSDETKAQWHR